MRSDSKTRYGTISIALHWGMAVLILWQMLKIFDRMADGEHWVGQNLVPWHVSIGSALLLLIAGRLIWTLKQRAHRPEQNPAEAFLVHAGHFLLYAGMVLMPITGILTMLGGGYGWSAFGVQLVAKGDEIPWASALGSLHSPIAWILLILILGHGAIALFHHFVRKDGVLKRMM